MKAGAGAANLPSMGPAQLGRRADAPFETGKGAEEQCPKAHVAPGTWDLGSARPVTGRPAAQPQRDACQEGHRGKGHRPQESASHGGAAGGA